MESLNYILLNLKSFKYSMFYNILIFLAELYIDVIACKSCVLGVSIMNLINFSEKD